MLQLRMHHSKGQAPRTGCVLLMQSCLVNCDRVSMAPAMLGLTG